MDHLNIFENINPQMQTANFWIDKITDPNRLIMDFGEIDCLNRKNLAYL